MNLANQSAGHASLAVIETAAEQAAVAPQVLALAKTAEVHAAYVQREDHPHSWSLHEIHKNLVITRD